MCRDSKLGCDVILKIVAKKDQKNYLNELDVLEKVQKADLCE